MRREAHTSFSDKLLSSHGFLAKEIIHPSKMCRTIQSRVKTVDLPFSCDSFSPRTPRRRFCRCLSCYSSSLVLFLTDCSLVSLSPSCLSFHSWTWTGFLFFWFYSCSVILLHSCGRGRDEEAHFSQMKCPAFFQEILPGSQGTLTSNSWEFTGKTRPSSFPWFVVAIDDDVFSRSRSSQEEKKPILLLIFSLVLVSFSLVFLS